MVCFPRFERFFFIDETTGVSPIFFDYCYSAWFFDTKHFACSFFSYIHIIIFSLWPIVAETIVRRTLKQSKTQTLTESEINCYCYFIGCRRRCRLKRRRRRCCCCCCCYSFFRSLLSFICFIFNSFFSLCDVFVYFKHTHTQHIWNRI